MNNLYQQMMAQNQSLPNNLKQLINVFRNSSNPQQLIANMVRQNPQVKQMMQTIQNSGKSPKDLFYQMAPQYGINPDEFVKQLK